MSFQLENWQEEALALNAKERKIRQGLEQMVTEILPVGVGALSWITLQLEIRGWGRFHNRRQVASYTGLCPGIHNSNGRGREGRINRCGNTIVRYTLIEMVWRLIRWQPDYPPIKKLRNALLSKRGKRRLTVAAARRLAIDLLALGHRSGYRSRTWFATLQSNNSKIDHLNIGTNTDLGTARVRVLTWALK